ncbi:MAG: energy-coupling factor transporter transmembrane component T [Nitrososphaerota archaeon]
MLRGLQLTSTNTFLNGVDPRVKLVFVAAVSVLSLALSSFTSLLFLALLPTLTLSLARALGRARFFIVSFLVFSALSVFVVYLLRFGSALEFAKFFVRVFAVMNAGLFFAFTTSPNKFSRGLEKLKVPRSVSFTLTLTIRFIPVFLKEAEEVLSSLKVRGVKLGIRGFIKNPKVVLRSLTIPLIVRMVKTSDDLASALESRGFGSPAKKTSLHEVKVGKVDLAFLSITMAFLVSLLLLDPSFFSFLDFTAFWRFMV